MTELCIINLSADIRNHGAFETFSSFPFESHLYKIKSMIKGNTRNAFQLFRHPCCNRYSRSWVRGLCAPCKMFSDKLLLWNVTILPRMPENVVLVDMLPGFVRLIEHDYSFIEVGFCRFSYNKNKFIEPASSIYHNMVFFAIFWVLHWVAFRIRLTVSALLSPTTKASELFHLYMLHQCNPVFQCQIYVSDKACSLQNKTGVV